MATIKSYTDLEQSRKLAKILPLESADMHYCLEKRDVATGYEIGVTPFIKVKRFEGKGNIINIQPAWSLTALLKIIGHYTLQTAAKDKKVFIVSEENYPICSDDYSEPIDACYEMIIKLNELNLL